MDICWRWIRSINYAAWGGLRIILQSLTPLFYLFLRKTVQFFNWRWNVVNGKMNVKALHFDVVYCWIQFTPVLYACSRIVWHFLYDIDAQRLQSNSALQSKGRLKGRGQRLWFELRYKCMLRVNFFRCAMWSDFSLMPTLSSIQLVFNVILFIIQIRCLFILALLKRETTFNLIFHKSFIG